jgi:hypothetical protein
MPAADSRAFIQWLDADDRIMAVNDEWVDFARENDAPHLDRPAVLHRSIWEFVTSGEMQAIYELIINRVRTGQATMWVPFRCDAPDQRRFMEMEVAPLSGGQVRMSSRIRHLEPRPAIGPWHSTRQPGQRIVTVCSWCKRVEVRPKVWAEVEDALALLQPAPGEAAPGLSHGFCEPCAEQWFQKLGVDRLLG